MTHGDNEACRRAEIIQVCRLMHTRGYVAATDGNVSARLDRERLLVTPSGLSKGLIEPEELIIVDMEGVPLAGGPAGLRCTSEILLHLEVYRRRPDAGAVVHAHPPIAVALSIAGIPIDRSELPEVLISLGSIPTTRYAAPASAEGPAAIAELIVAHDALMLPRHGSVTVGAGPLEAYLKLEKVEHSAEISLLLALLGADAPLPEQERARLLTLRRVAGGSAT